jgi:hypothetical protein
LVSTNVAAQCNWTPRYSAQLRTTALDVSVLGTEVWVATSYGVQLVENERIVASVALPGVTRTVHAAASGLAYVGSGSRIYAIRRVGETLRIAGSVAASGVVYDFAVVTYLFAATSGGIDHFDLVDPNNPFKTGVRLASSSANVTSLAVGRNTLYAADGDNTVEIYSIAVPSVPQNIGTLESLPRATRVHFTSDNLLYVSDALGQNTDVFAGNNRVARVPYGTNAFEEMNLQTHFAAGPDRTLRLIDFSNAARIAKRFELQLAPTDGTDNAIHAMDRSGTSLYIAAGDLGLVILDTDRLATRPAVYVSYADGATNSVHAQGDRAWFAHGSGTIVQHRVLTTGVSLEPERIWNAGAGAVIRDGREGALLTSSGNSVTLWALAPATPNAVLTATFSGAVVAAVTTEAHIAALLADGSLWTVTASQTAPQRVNVAPMALLARSGSSIALAEVREDDRKTVLHYYPNGDFSAEPRRFTVDGAATGTIALNAARAAIFTFNGINVIDVASGAVSLIAGSNALIPRQLLYRGDDLFALDGRRLHVFSTANAPRRHELPADAAAVAVTGGVAVLATTEGTAAAMYDAVLPQPVTPLANSYPTKLAASTNHLYLFDRDGVEVFDTALGNAPHYVTTISTIGIDLTANATTVFTLAANGTVTAWSPQGARLAQALVSEGIDSQALSIHTAANAVWVSISTGCTTGGCQRKTLVLDPHTLAITASLAGSVRDVVTSGTRAYALFDLPNELRVINLADPLHPATVVFAPRINNAVSVAYDASTSTIYVLADRLFSFNESTLTQTGSSTTAMAVDPLQQIRIDGGCAIVTGRGEGPELYALPSFAAPTPFALPSAARRVIVQGNRLFILTGHSLEIWSRGPAQNPRRRAV